MKKLILLTPIILLFSCGGEMNLSENFYKHLTGKIGDRKITVDFFRNGENVTMIYYDKKGNPVTCSGKITKDFKFEIKESKTKNYEIFKAEFVSENKIKGTWNKDNKKKKTDFKLSENYDNSVKFKTLSLDEKTKRGKDIDCSDKIIFHLPKKKKDLQKKILKIFFEAEKGKPKEIFDNFHKKFFKEFSAETFETSWYRNTMADIIYNDNNLLCYAVHWDSFMGGAHPNYASNFYVFNSKTEKQLKIKDIIIAGNEKKLQKIIYEKIKINRNFDDKEMKIYSSKFPLKNFYINAKGIGFFYNPYEIAAYIYGADDVFIPYEEIINILNTKKLKILK